MSVVGNCQIQSHLLSTIIILITLLSNFHYSQSQSHVHLMTNISSSSSSSKRLIHDLNKTMLCHPHQSLALLRFKSSFVLDTFASRYCEHSYPKTETWNEGTDCCSSWDGVTCHPATGHVISLGLSCSQLQLQGTISSSIFSLPSLKKLNLAFNDFSAGSNILSQFGVKFADTLTHLNLSNSKFSCSVPSEISYLSKLVSLDLSRNDELRVESDGVLKSIAQNLTHLRVLNLHSVNMSAVLQPASSMMNLSSSLISLTLSYCQLQGNFPASFLLLPSLQELHLSFNYLKGPLIPKYSWSANGNNTTHNSNIRVLDLSYTGLSGVLPSDFVANLKSLMVLDLSYCHFSGSIPASLGNLTKITRLDLSKNQFSGKVPSSIGNLNQLVSLYMEGNMLRGQIPNSILNLTQLEFLILSVNRLEGPLPSSPSHLHEHTALFPYLQYLDVSENLLNATIPPWLFALPSLGHIDLHNNSFRGHLDHEFVSQSLEFVSLGTNNLSGPLPRNLSTSASLEELYLHNNLFNGTIPSSLFAHPSLQGLSLLNNSFTGHLEEFVSESLAFLCLSNNQLSGPIPNLSHSVSLLELYLDRNMFTGGLAQVPWYSNIEVIDLHSNLLEGPLPILPHSTMYLSVSNNSFTGQISSQLCYLEYLDVLDLSSNKFFGLIPQCLGNTSDLSVFNLGMNNFHGTIPDNFFRGNSLRFLNLNGNRLKGILPQSLINCRELQVLDLGNNLISDVFPEWLRVLPQLQVLALRSNQFYGLVDIGVKVNHSFPMLRILDLSDNNFSGALPARLINNLKGVMNIPASELGGPHYMMEDGKGLYEFSMMVTMKGIDTQLVKILTIFTTIDLSNNRFEGKIPKEIGNLLSLKGLNLSNNCLIGSIPPAIGKMVSLEWLDLSSNQLVGRIPLLLVDLTFLAVLNLSHNNLYGPIPTGTQFNTFQVDSYVGNTGLCGFPLPKTCGSGRSNPPVESSFQKKDSYDSAIDLNWKGVIVGYGCGTVFGVAMGYLVFSTGSPKWFVRMVQGKRRRIVQRSKRNVKVRVPIRN